uniref:Uncharacterized protein n=1 Tax=Cannabis sativa TaxID=3483 RepID=A0A803NIM5_CANSA
MKSLKLSAMKLARPSKKTEPPIERVSLLLWEPPARSGLVAPRYLASFRSHAKLKVPKVGVRGWMVYVSVRRPCSGTQWLVMSFQSLVDVEGGLGFTPKGCVFLVPSLSLFRTIIGGRVWLFLVECWQCSEACVLPSRACILPPVC